MHEHGKNSANPKLVQRSPGEVLQMINTISTKIPELYDMKISGRVDQPAFRSFFSDVHGQYA